MVREIQVIEMMRVSKSVDWPKGQGMTLQMFEGKKFAEF
jgi:hypothetical protein